MLERLTKVAIALILIAVSIWLVRSHMEAEAFSRITGEQISTWDAMWVELRVDRPLIK